MVAKLLTSALLLASLQAGMQSAPVTAGGESTRDDPRGSFLEIVVGAVGGIRAPLTRERLLIGYDWNRREFRAVALVNQASTGVEVSVTALTPEEFAALMDGMLERGLGSLPLEDPAGGADIYGCGTTLAFRHRGVAWENQVPGGCVRSPSTLQPTQEQVQTFNELVASARKAASSSTARPGSLLDAFSIPTLRSVAEARRFVLAAEALADDPRGDLLDLNRPSLPARKRSIIERLDSSRAAARAAAHGELETGPVFFPWRWDQPGAISTLGWVAPIGRAEPAGCVVIYPDRPAELSLSPLPPGASEAQQHRADVARAHVDLTEAERDLVRAGWVLPVSSEAAALAAWGPPAAQRGDEWHYERDGRLVTVQITRARDGLVPAD